MVHRAGSKSAADSTAHETVEPDSAEDARGERRGVQLSELAFRVDQPDDDDGDDGAEEAGEGNLGRDTIGAAWAPVMIAEVAVAARTGRHTERGVDYMRQAAKPWFFT